MMESKINVNARCTSLAQVRSGRSIERNTRSRYESCREEVIPIINKRWESTLSTREALEMNINWYLEQDHIGEHKEREKTCRQCRITNE